MKNLSYKREYIEESLFKANNEILELLPPDRVATVDFDFDGDSLKAVTELAEKYSVSIDAVVMTLLKLYIIQKR